MTINIFPSRISSSLRAFGLSINRVRVYVCVCVSLTTFGTGCVLTHHVQERQILEFAPKVGGIRMLAAKVHVRTIVVDAVPEMRGGHRMQQQTQLVRHGSLPVDGHAGGIVSVGHFGGQWIVARLLAR